MKSVLGFLIAVFGLSEIAAAQWGGVGFDLSFKGGLNERLSYISPSLSEMGVLSDDQTRLTVGYGSQTNFVARRHLIRLAELDVGLQRTFSFSESWHSILRVNYGGSYSTIEKTNSKGDEIYWTADTFQFVEGSAQIQYLLPESVGNHIRLHGGVGYRANFLKEKSDLRREKSLKNPTFYPTLGLSVLI